MPRTGRDYLTFTPWKTLNEARNRMLAPCNSITHDASWRFSQLMIKNRTKLAQIISDTLDNFQAVQAIYREDPDLHLELAFSSSNHAARNERSRRHAAVIKVFYCSKLVASAYCSHTADLKICWENCSSQLLAAWKNMSSYLDEPDCEWYSDVLTAHFVIHRK